MNDSIQPPDQLSQTVLKLIVNNQNPETLLSVIARSLGEWFHGDVCLTIAGTQKTIRKQISFVEKGQNQSLSPGVEHQLIVQTQLGDLFNEIEPTVISDLNQIASNSTVKLFQDLLSVQSLLGIATFSQGEINGFVVIGHFQPYQWSSSEQELLQKLKAVLAIAMSQAQLQSQVQTSSHYQSLINELTSVTRNSSALDTILQTALTGTAEALQVYQGMLLLLRYDKPVYGHRSLTTVPKARATIASQWSLNNQSQKQTTDKFRLVDCDLCRQAWQDAPNSLTISDCQDFSGELIMPKIFQIPQTRALLMVPLMGSGGHNSHAGTVLGFLVLQHQQPRVWQPDELEFVNWVSAQVSTAIIHHQSLRQVHSLVDEQTAKLKWSLEVQAKLSEKMRHQLEQLQRADKLKGEFLDTIQHELKTPLTEMKLAIQMLKIPGRPPERQAQYLDILEKAWNRENQLIQDLLTWRTLQLEEYTIQPTKLNLSRVIGELSQSFEEQWKDKGITLIAEYYSGSTLQDAPESLPSFSTDLESFQRIISELFLNAGKFSDPQTTVTLKVQQDVDRILLSMTNSGCGLSEKEQDCIFDPFYRGQGITDDAIPGTGLGLALVKSLVEHLDGKIEVSSDNKVDQQTSQICFTLSLPQVSLAQ